LPALKVGFASLDYREPTHSQIIHFQRADARASDRHSANRSASNRDRADCYSTQCRRAERDCQQARERECSGSRSDFVWHRCPRQVLDADYRLKTK
jgi:hypothetical protein